jgi:hypothetical protein
LRSFGHVGHRGAKAGLGALQRFFGLLNLDFAGPHVGARKHDLPVRLNDGADELLQAVAQEKERTLGVDPRQDDRHTVSQHPGAAQQRLRVTQLGRVSILGIERKEARRKPRRIITQPRLGRPAQQVALRDAG